jgi:hypothetical protein
LDEHIRGISMSAARTELRELVPAQRDRTALGLGLTGPVARTHEAGVTTESFTEAGTSQTEPPQNPVRFTSTT